MEQALDHAWFRELEKRCNALLQSADQLLARYHRPRHRSGPSMAGRILCPCLTGLQGLEVLLDTAEQSRLHALEHGLSERHRLLSRRRVPLCPELHRMRSSCRELALSVPKMPAAWDSPSVLVGSLRRASQLDICLEHNFYHVPVSQIPDGRLPISYIAIYQSRTLFPEDCGIRFYGQISKCTLVRRHQIHEIPKDSDELYYRLEVSHWQQLDRPIAVREVPFTHLFTNLFLLTHSRETPELSLVTPTQYRYYQTLRYAPELGSGTVLRHPGGTVRLKNGQFQIRRRGRRIAVFRTEDFLKTPAAIFRRLMNVLDKKS